MRSNLQTWARFHKSLCLINIVNFPNTKVAIELRLISIVRLIVTRCETGQRFHGDWEHLQMNSILPLTDYYMNSESFTSTLCKIHLIRNNIQGGPERMQQL